MSFQMTDGGSSPAVNTTRLRRQLVEQAIDAATAAEWDQAAEINKRILDLGPDSEAENRLARAYWEMGELSQAREHYQAALALDPTNRIAERNIGRLRMLMAEAGKKTVPAQKGSKAPVSIFVEETGKTGFAHLVDLPDAKKLAQVNPGDSVELEPEGTRLIAISPGESLAAKTRRAMSRMVGAYSLCILGRDRLLAVRDPLGVRPLCIGRLGDHWVVASESCALMTIGAELVREVAPGEIVEIDSFGLQSYMPASIGRNAMCLFELIYFARPDSQIHGQRLHLVRQRMGEQLAIEQPADADIVVGLPDSATPAAIGYARKSGLPYTEALIKNRYIGRTFIQPDQRLREIGVSLKFNALPEVLDGKRVVLVDDTIVRGTTSRPIVNMLRQAGASEVHMRVHAPPMMWPCYLGVDLARRDELIAARMSVPEIGRFIGADSIGYLSLEGLIEAIDAPGAGFCTGCLTGAYPLPVQLGMDKLILEHA